jgi:hypothetical protein
MEEAGFKNPYVPVEWQNLFKTHPSEYNIQLYLCHSNGKNYVPVKFWKTCQEYTVSTSVSVMVPNWTEFS